MNMTREEAIEVLENGGWWDSLIPVTTIEGRIEDDKFHEALDLALSALRPVSREQIEKVWKGEWIEELYNTTSERNRIIHCKKCICSVCNKSNGRKKENFCPHCGAPMKDEAVDMVMERMKELYEKAD